MFMFGHFWNFRCKCNHSGKVGTTFSQLFWSSKKRLKRNFSMKSLTDSIPTEFSSSWHRLILCTWLQGMMSYICRKLMSCLLHVCSFRFRASTHYRTELMPEERAVRLTEMLNYVAGQVAIAEIALTVLLKVFQKCSLSTYSRFMEQ